MSRIPVAAALSFLLVALNACAPFPTTQAELFSEHPPVTYHVDGSLFDVFQHTAYWVRECSRDAKVALFEERGFATFRLSGEYFIYDARLTASPTGGTDVTVSSASERAADSLARWLRGETGCRPA